MPTTPATVPTSTTDSAGTRTSAGGTYGDFVPQAPDGLRDPSRGAELERELMPPDADFSRVPEHPDPAELSREDRIRAAAFRKYEQRVGASGDAGDAQADWLQAEAEVDAAAAEPVPRERP